MSILKQIHLPGGSSSGAYVRPGDWLSLPAVTAGEQKFVGLYAVWPHESNFVAVNCAGAYTVDWGDGSAPQNVATGVQANHNFVWADVGAGTVTSRGYRQAVVTITPQGAGNLTTVNLLVKNSQAGLVGAGTTGWLDIRMAAPNLTVLTIGGVTTNVAHRMLEQFEFIGTNGVTSFANKFQNCTGLRSLVSLHTGAATVFNNMFNGCVALTTIPLLNTASGTTFANMFQGCTSLEAVPLLNTAAGVGAGFGSMFNGCTSLQSVPVLSTGGGSDFSSMFLNCSALQVAPELNTGAGTTFASMFSGCISLPTIPLLNTAAGLTFTSMFSSCSALEVVPALVTASGTVFTSMFFGCPSLRSAPLAGTAADISYASCSLGPAALDAIYAGLAAGVVSKTVTVTGNWGTTADTPSIATAKSWTVTGS